MSVLPRLSGREVVKALMKIGYEQDRQRGSHIILRQAVSPHRRLVVPDHREVAKGRCGQLFGKPALPSMNSNLYVNSVA